MLLMRLRGVWLESICINMFDEDEGEVLLGDGVPPDNLIIKMMSRRVLFDINAGYICNRMKSIIPPENIPDG